MHNQIIDKEVLTTFEAAEICNSSFNSIKRWIQSGKLSAYKTPGGHYRIQKEDLRRFLQRNNFPSKSFESFYRKKILIVDDDSQVRTSLANNIQKLYSQYEVYTASNGFEAGAQVVQYNPDIIILDLMMPFIDGFSICRTIKENPGTKHIVIVVITGFGDENNVDQAYKCGADKVLCKPFHCKDIIGEIEYLLENRRYKKE